MEKVKNKIFKKGSRTYFYSSLFFPKIIRAEVATLYAFVRTADDYVDSIPQRKDEFDNFCLNFNSAWSKDFSGNKIIDEFIILARKKELKKDWIDSFLHSMAEDLEKKKYYNISETLNYIYGSAEVIGLMMARLMGLPNESYRGAQLLGRSMQQINFIRDIKEDNDLERQYLPIEEMQKAGLLSLNLITAKKNKKAYIDFIETQIERYKQWQQEAEKYFIFLPWRYQIPIRTASAMYNYTAKKIINNPFLVFEKKIKPNKVRIISTGFQQLIVTLCRTFFLNIKKRLTRKTNQ